jgi:enoyl-CoA hydratase
VPRDGRSVGGLLVRVRQAEGARVGLPEVKRGLFAAGGGTFIGTRIPLAVALELALTGDPLDAGRAQALGLVNAVVPAGEVLAVALDYAARIAANGPLAVAASKRIVVAAQDWSEEEAWQRQGEIAGPVMTSEDAREGATAFAEKRPPVWRAR